MLKKTINQNIQPLENNFELIPLTSNNYVITVNVQPDETKTTISRQTLINTNQIKVFSKKN